MQIFLFCYILLWLYHQVLVDWCVTFTHVLHDCSLHWRHDDHDGVSNHQPHGCLLNRWFRHRSKKASKLRVTGLCTGNSPGPVNPRHKWPVMRKMVPFDDVIMFTGTGGTIVGPQYQGRVPEEIGLVDIYLTTTKHNKTYIIRSMYFEPYP